MSGTGPLPPPPTANSNSIIHPLPIVKPDTTTPPKDEPLSQTQTPGPTTKSAKNVKPAKSKNPKKYRCSYCDRAFTRSEHRSRHERSHTKEKPFHCPKCPSAFVRRDLLLRHDRTVHAPKNGAKNVGISTKKIEKKPSKTQLPAPKSNNKKQTGLNGNSNGNGNGEDVDFNAALLMTELQHSFHKPSPQDSSASKAPPSPPPHDYLPPLGLNNHTHSALDLSSQLPANADTNNNTNKRNSISYYHYNQHQPHPHSHSQSHSQSYTHPSHIQQNNHHPHPHPPPPPPPPHHHLSHSHSHSAGAPPPPPPAAPPPHPISPHFSNNAATTPTPTSAASSQTNYHQNQPHQSHQHHHPQQQHHHHHQQPPHNFLNSLRESVNQTTNFQNFNELPIHIPQLDSNYQMHTLLKFFYDQDKTIMSQALTRVQFNRYMAAYFMFFHPHLPFLHVPTFDPESIAPTLIFSVCSIGAALCNEDANGNMLHYTAKMMINSIFEVDKDFPQSRKTPLWAIQNIILVIAYAAWSADPRGLEFISTIRAPLASITSGLFHDENGNNGNNNETTDQLNWKKWLDEESKKRTCFAVFTVFGSLGQVYNYPTALTNNDIPIRVQLPCSEALWNQSFANENDWVYQFMRETNNSCNQTQFNHALGSLVNEQPQSIPPLSPFALKIMSIALFNELLSSHTAHYSREKSLSVLKCWDSIARDTHPNQGQMSTQFACNSSLLSLSIPMENHMNILLDCPSPFMAKLKTQHPLLVTSYITSLVTQVRLLVDLTSAQEMIRFLRPNDICETALSSYTVLSTTGRLRSPQLTILMAKCFDMFRLPLVLGTRVTKSLFTTPLMSSTAESVLCQFELVTALAMWCHRLEQDISNGEQLDEEESILYTMIERCFADCGVEKNNGQLAPSLAIFGAENLESFETWGLASVLSVALKSFGCSLIPHQQNAQNTSNQNQSRSRNSPSSISNPQSTNFQYPPQQSHPQSSLRTTASDRDMFSLPFKTMS